MARTIIRFPAVKDATGKGRSAIYDDVSRGLFTKPVKLGPRCVGWPDDEVSTINNARIAGADDDTIRRLVEKLHNARKATAPAI